MKAYLLHSKNLLRWVGAHIVSWGVLFFIYSLTLSVLLQAVLSNLTQSEFPLLAVWVSSVIGILICGFLEWLPLLRFPLLPGRLIDPLRWGGPVGRLYLLHEFRRNNLYVTLLVVVLVGVLLPEAMLPFFVFLFQVPVQKSLYAVQKWRNLAVIRFPHTGARQFLYGFILSQVGQFFLAVVFLTAILALGGEIHPEWGRVVIASLGAVLAGSAVALEGDSGRPWLVNVISLSAGSLAGFLTLYSGWVLLGVFYFANQVIKLSQNRLQSVEIFDEDTILP